MCFVFAEYFAENAANFAERAVSTYAVKDNSCLLYTSRVYKRQRLYRPAFRHPWHQCRRQWRYQYVHYKQWNLCRFHASEVHYFLSAAFCAEISGERRGLTSTSQPVSYTHLDVYKRQAYVLTALSAKFAAFSAKYSANTKHITHFNPN